MPENRNHQGRQGHQGLGGLGGEIALRAPILALVLSLAATTALAQGNAQHGQQVFQDNCSGCHSLTGPGYGGPPLSGVYGRKAGTAAGFEYTDAMKKSGIVWSDTSLNDFLTDPSKLVPGTSMAFSVSEPQQRDDVIAYLKTLSPASR